MHVPSTAAPRLAGPPGDLPLTDVEALALAGLVLALAGLFAIVRVALLHSVPARVLALAPDDDERERLRPLLARADALRTSASTYTVAFQLLFLALVLSVAWRGEATWLGTAAALLVSVPLVVFVCEVLPAALRGRRHDVLLVRFLPLFHVLQLPLVAPVHLLELFRRATMRALRIPERPRAAREILEGLRDVVEDSSLEGDLGEAEREIIENVFEFHDVDVGEIMTPRTEIRAVDLGAGLEEVVRVFAESGHGRIPVHRGSLDSVAGVVAARDVLRVLAGGDGDRVRLSDIMRPVVFVPETKQVSQLLQEFRRERNKLAIVLDEYGGTAGLVTLGDVLAEIVGDMVDEWEEDESIVRLDDGAAEVPAAYRVSEVNEELDLELPEEEDYETLAGFVLARLGRFPKRGESLIEGDLEFTVLEANDRRVLRVRVRRLQPQAAG